jgi:hypothetical protein
MVIYGDCMNALRSLLTSPEYYPIVLDVERRVLKFVRMARENYHDSVFLDLRTRHTEAAAYEIRLEDLLLASNSTPSAGRPVHYVLNTAYCCSTLLARYFELLPSCLVLKEPRLLAQMTVMENRAAIPWDATLNLCLRLLSRTYDPGQQVIIKAVDSCSMLGHELLARNSQSTVTFLMTPLRHFLLSVLKSGERRDWAHARLRHAFKSAREIPPLLAIGDFERLSVAEAAACLWLIHRYLCGQLCSGPHGDRVRVVNGQRLAAEPAQALPGVLALCGLPAQEPDIRRMVTDPSMQKYSKDLSRPYDAGSRSRELAELEGCWSAEADAGEEFVERYGWKNAQIDAELGESTTLSTA